jgi:hypothetical protein
MYFKIDHSMHVNRQIFMRVAYTNGYFVTIPLCPSPIKRTLLIFPCLKPGVLHGGGDKKEDFTYLSTLDNKVSFPL